MNPRQSEINESEWRNPSNWTRRGIGGIYAGKRDTRLLVPKATPIMGWTLNFAHPASKYVLGGLVLIPIVVVTLNLPFWK